VRGDGRGAVFLLDTKDVAEALGLGHEQAEWQEWTDFDVLVVQKIFLGALQDRVRRQ
jgi:hypothetical protein